MLSATFPDLGVITTRHAGAPKSSILNAPQIYSTLLRGTHPVALKKDNEAITGSAGLLITRISNRMRWRFEVNERNDHASAVNGFRRDNAEPTIHGNSDGRIHVIGNLGS